MINRKIINNSKANIKKWLKIRKNKFFLIGLFFLFLQLFVIWGNYSTQGYDIFFWFCNHTPLILSLAFFFNKRDVLKALINVGFLIQFFWTIDFVLKLFFDFYFLGVTRYVFEDLNGIGVLIPIMIHILATNLAFYFTYDRKPRIKVLLYSLVYILFLFATTILFTLESNNVNCIYLICSANNLTFQGYTYFWSLIVFFIIVLPTQAIQYYVWKYHIYKKKIRKN